MNTLTSMSPRPFSMATQNNPVGRRKKPEEEKAERRKEILFTHQEWEEVNAPLVSGQALGTVIHDLSLRWARGEVVPVADLEEYRSSVLSRIGTDDFAAPLLGSVTCGPLKEAIAEADEFVVNRQTRGFLKGEKGDFWLDVEGESMEPKVPDGARVLLRPFGEFGRPNPGQIVLVEISRDDEEPTYTLKRWRKTSPVEVEKGDGEAYLLPPDANVRAVAFLCGYMMSLI